MSNKEDIKIVSDEDYEIIEGIASKYSMSIEDFGRLISKKKGKQIINQVKYSNIELERIDKRAAALGVTRSKYCRLCYKKALETELYKKINILETVKSKTKRDLVVNISFDDENEYKKMRELSKKFSVPFSNLIRYFSLNVKLSK